MLGERFSGTVDEIAELDVQQLVEWALAIPFAEWPQQAPVDDGLRPAMVTDPEWHGFGALAQPIIDAVLARFPAGCRVPGPLLTVVMPGHDIPPHVDAQGADWLARVHHPLTTNAESRFMVGGEAHHLEVGKAYRVNTERRHAVENAGATARIHLMYDVLLPAGQRSL